MPLCTFRLLWRGLVLELGPAATHLIQALHVCDDGDRTMETASHEVDLPESPHLSFHSLMDGEKLRLASCLASWRLGCPGILPVAADVSEGGSGPGPLQGLVAVFGVVEIGGGETVPRRDIALIERLIQVNRRLDVANLGLLGAPAKKGIIMLEDKLDRDQQSFLSYRNVQVGFFRVYNMPKWQFPQPEKEPLLLTAYSRQ